MVNFEDTGIRLYEKFIRDVTDIVIQKIDFKKLEQQDNAFLIKVKERFRFDNDNGWRFLTSSLDTIGDSQFAIITFINHKIENGESFNTGENYLRLYGLLSAVYIQQQAILMLVDLFKMGSINMLKQEFNNLEITFLRHCISAHPINYDSNGEKVSFKIDRNSINNKGILSIINGSNGSMAKYDIFDSLDTYLYKAESFLEQICRKLISNCFSTAKEKSEMLNTKLESIKINR